jgi:hypothetical protein
MYTTSTLISTPSCKISGLDMCPDRPLRPNKHSFSNNNNIRKILFPEFD